MFPTPLQNVIDELSKLPEIGPRAASRLAFYLLDQNQTELDKLSSAVKDLKNNIHLCKQCFNIAPKNNLCNFCQDTKREQNTICVVENILNIYPIDKTKQYNGLYHVLGGLISPANNIGPEKLRIQELVNRIRNGSVKEVIFAFSPTTEGDTTTFYIDRILNNYKIKKSRLARGLSFGSDLQYADANTLSRAFMDRK